MDTASNDSKSPFYFHSRRVRKEDIKKPWLLNPPDPREKWLTIMPFIAVFLGMCMAGVLIWDGWRGVVNQHYCLMFEDHFDNGFDTTIWSHEIVTGGFGSGSFEMTTSDEANVFVDDDGVLNIMPTLQDEGLIAKIGSRIDLGDACTAKDRFYCSSETWENGTIVPPVKSGRITTKQSHAITYGRIEVMAKMPVGDWLWPAIWMMPVEDRYGVWPRSGEIDIVETRGNNYTYPQGGNNIASSALHWGPDYATDHWFSTYKKRAAEHTTYSTHYHTFSLEWSQKYLFTYINNRLLQVLYVPFEKDLWATGHFETKVDENATAYASPWIAGAVNAPFDHPFYLILNVAVGATNAWFEDSVAGKPWSDDSGIAPKEFWDARDQWYPTWTQPAMQVKYVKMYQQCNGDEQEWGIKPESEAVEEDA
ncbi:unnamed protein product [Discula destructiva]